MQDYRKLRVWQAAHALVLKIYLVTKRFPAAERYGLTAQLRRSCCSIPANIAEGSMRSSDPGFGHFVQIAAASASESDYHLLLARDLGYLPPEIHEQLAAELQSLRRGLSALQKSLKKSAPIRKSRVVS
ncbi:MAG: four helix bundle protein [Gemmatimonadaceae bacterium]|nr:four helix bundle protein [Gemmatimonadaceae bacterium]